MLGHDYGFKRIMSSYYFQDTDQVVDKTEMIKWITRTRSKYWLQGPPGGAPASYPDICGNGWTCEHRLVQVFSTVGLLKYTYFIYFRWSSIMNMAQFANKVIGQPVTNWDVS